VARRILGEDVTQIDHYTERVKRMVGKVHLQRFTRYEQGTYDLVGGEELSDTERDEMLERCRQRLNAFRERQKRNGNHPPLTRNEVDHHIATERIGVAAEG
jgi:ATP adenylyltransferase